MNLDKLIVDVLIINCIYFFLSLFCKLAATLRTKITAFGHDVNISVRCLQVLVKAVDARYSK